MGRVGRTQHSAPPFKVPWFCTPTDEIAHLCMKRLRTKDREQSIPLSVALVMLDISGK